MKTNAAGLKLIEDYEGLELTAYQENLGGGKLDVPTIGYGHTSAAGPPVVYLGMTITNAQAETILSNDLSSVETQVSKDVTVPLNSNQFSALVSFTFNEGEGNLQGSTLLKRLNSGDYNIVDEFPKWRLAQGMVEPGLVKRRAAEAALWNTPVTSQPTVPVTPVQPPVAPTAPSGWLINFLFWLIQKLFGEQ